MAIGDNIRQMRERARMSTGDLAMACGVTLPAVFKWEHNQSLPAIENLSRLADIFECSVDEILGRDNRSA